MISSMVIKWTIKCLPNSEILCWIDLLWNLGLWKGSKGGKFWRRIETWKKQLAWIEILPIMALSWQQTVVAAQPRATKTHIKSLPFSWPDELSHPQHLASKKTLYTEVTEIINYAQVSSWPLTCTCTRETENMPALKQRELGWNLYCCSH